MIVYKQDDIVIRTYEENDIGSIVTLFDDKSISEYNQSKFLLLNITDELDRILVITKDDKVIGLADLMAYYDRIDISRIIIEKEYQGKGYDKLLVDTIKSIGNNEDRDIGCMVHDKYLIQCGFEDSGIGIKWKHTKQDMGIPKIFIDKEIQKHMNDNIDANAAAEDLNKRGIKL